VFVFAVMLPWILCVFCLFCCFVVFRYLAIVLLVVMRSFLLNLMETNKTSPRPALASYALGMNAEVAGNCVFLNDDSVVYIVGRTAVIFILDDAKRKQRFISCADRSVVSLSVFVRHVILCLVSVCVSVCLCLCSCGR